MAIYSIRVLGYAGGSEAFGFFGPLTPIPGATVQLTALNGYVSATTDALGVATFSSLGICTTTAVSLRVDAAGYKTDVFTTFAGEDGAPSNGGDVVLAPGSGWRHADRFGLPRQTPLPFRLDLLFSDGHVSAGSPYDFDLTLRGVLSGETLTYNFRVLPVVSGGINVTVPLATNWEWYEVQAKVYRGFPTLSPPDQTFYGWCGGGGMRGEGAFIWFTFDAGYIPHPPPPTGDGDGTGPCILVTERCRYFEAHSADGQIRLNRSLYPTSPFDFQTTVTTGSDPSLAEGAEWRLHLLLTRATGEDTSDVRRTYSDDAGETWSEPEMAFPGGSHGAVRVERESKIRVEAAFVSGKIQGIITGSEDDAPFTFQVDDGGSLIDLDVEDVGFDIFPAGDDERRWLLLATPSGGSENSRWQSWDRCRTWKAI